VSLKVFHVVSWFVLQRKKARRDTVQQAALMAAPPVRSVQHGVEQQPTSCQKNQ
jgi:hypothetical protein